MLNITLNAEKSGIEVRFDEKPDQKILDVLKSNGFKWSNYQKIWWAKQSDARMEILEDLAKECSKKLVNNNPIKKEDYDLWQLTRTDDIEQHHCYDNKEIAASIRKHLRERFPMVKWSVTSNRYDVNVYIKCSPFAKDSDELKAIVVYACKYTDSWNYDNSDLMSDYFDVNFYSNVRHAVRYDGEVWIDNVLDNDYTVREMTISEQNISDNFRIRKEDWEKEEEIRSIEEEARRAEEMIRAEEERKAYEERREAARKKIEAEAEIKDVDYFVVGTYTTNASKEDHLDGYFDDCDGRIEVEKRYEDCKVSREIHLSEGNYNNFTKMLLTDWSFLEHMGGTGTDDERINCSMDYSAMTPEERETVEWYCINCVAVFCDGEMKFIIDPQGYSYARYCYFLDEESEKKSADYKHGSGIPEDAAAENKKLAEKLEKISDEVLCEIDVIENGEDLPEYKGMIKERLAREHFPLSKGVVQALTNLNIKSCMYEIEREYNGMQEQFKRSGLSHNQKITIIKMSEFGGLSVSHGIFKGYVLQQYAQHKDAVKLIYRPEGKRKDYYAWLYGKLFIVNGYVDIPETLLWDISTDPRTGWVMKKSKYLSCDRRILEVTRNYLEANKFELLINTF